MRGPKKADGVKVFHEPDIRRIVEKEMGVEYKSRSLYPVLRRIGLSCLAPRPKHPKGDRARQEA
ncbi:MAG: winged helix-turn-helix domain-containing protein [Candidatus Omnitrophota bacterium]